jgi:uncharacterized SAM-binding protein YcdF (DUF218 family)
MLLGLLLALVGWLLSRRARKRPAAGCFAAAVAIVYLGSTTLVGNALIAPLEESYPPFSPDRAPEVQDIVILGSGYEPGGGLPVTAALDADGLARIVEGVHLIRERPHSKLWVSGGAPPGLVPAARGYAQLAEQLGVAHDRIATLETPRDTAEEAREISRALGDKPFILVTSAFHMPRAMRLMHGAGLHPIAAPTAHLVHRDSPSDRIGLIPSSRGLHRTETALHEYVGIAASALRVYR